MRDLQRIFKGSLMGANKGSESGFGVRSSKLMNLPIGSIVVPFWDYLIGF